MPARKPLLSLSLKPAVIFKELRESNTFNSFWAGGELPPLAWACYASLGSKRLRTVIYSYNDIRVPLGTTRKDARRILPRKALFKALDSYSPFSNLFRFKLLNKKGGWWVDADVICTKGIVPSLPEDIYGWEDRTTVNCGQMRLTRKSRIAREALEVLRKTDFKSIDWGDTGPKTLTSVLHKLKLLDKARPRQMFYPLHWLEAYKLILADEYDYVESLARQGSFIHAWGSVFRYFGFDARRNLPQPGSYLDKLYAKEGVYKNFTLSEPDWPSVYQKIRSYLSEEWVVQFLQSQHLPLDLDFDKADGPAINVNTNLITHKHPRLSLW